MRLSFAVQPHGRKTVHARAGMRVQFIRQSGVSLKSLFGFLTVRRAPFSFFAVNGMIKMK